MGNVEPDSPRNITPDDEGMIEHAWRWLTVHAPDIATVFAIFFMVVLLFSWIHISGVTADGFSATFKKISIPMGIILFLSLVLTNLRKTLLGQAATIFILIYCVAAMKQFLLAHYPPPGLPAFYCFINIFEKGCPGSPNYTSVALAEAELVPVPTSTSDSEGAVAGSNADQDDADVSSSAPSLPPLISTGPVFLQFSGNVQRAALIDIAQKLVTEGWRVQGADRGGERTAAAAGINEVRYFYPEDKAAAQSLVESIKGLAPWTSSPLTVQDFSASGYSPPRGQLEIWVSA